MLYPRHLVVADVRAAAAWYAEVFAAVTEAIDDGHARLVIGTAPLVIVLERGPPPPPAKTPVLELGVVEVAASLARAVAAGATRATPESLEHYAQLRDPWGYLWALALRDDPDDDQA